MELPELVDRLESSISEIMGVISLMDDTDKRELALAKTESEYMMFRFRKAINQ